MKVVEGEKWRSMKININKIKSAFSVFGVLISVFLITDLHAMWENERHLYTQGMLDSFSEDQKLYSPILGMVLLESDIAPKIYHEKAINEQGEENHTSRSELAQNLLHELDGNLRKTVRASNPFKFINATEFGLLAQLLVNKTDEQEIDTVINDFIESDQGKAWHERTVLAGGTGIKKIREFKKKVRTALRPLVALPVQERARIFSMFAAAMSQNPEDLKEYVSAFTGRDISVPVRYDSEKPIDDPLSMGDEPLLTRLLNYRMNLYQRLNPRAQLYVTLEGTKVPICAEQSIWGFVNLVLYNPATEKLDLSMLPKTVTMTSDLRSFVENHSNILMPNYFTSLKNKWKRMVDEVPGIDYQGKLDLPTDARTTLHVLNNFFGLPKNTNWQELGEKLSTKKRTVSLKQESEEFIKVEMKEMNHSNEDNNYELLAEWRFQKEHASLEIESDQSIDPLIFLKRINQFEKKHSEVDLSSLINNAIYDGLRADLSLLKKYDFSTRGELIKLASEVPNRFNAIVSTNETVLFELLYRLALVNDIEGASYLFSIRPDLKSAEFIEKMMDFYPNETILRFYWEHKEISLPLLFTVMFKLLLKNTSKLKSTQEEDVVMYHYLKAKIFAIEHIIIQIYGNMRREEGDHMANAVLIRDINLETSSYDYSTTEEVLNWVMSNLGLNVGITSDLAQKIHKLAGAYKNENVIKYFNELNNKGLK